MPNLLVDEDDDCASASGEAARQLARPLGLEPIEVALEALHTLTS